MKISNSRGIQALLGSPGLAGVLLVASAALAFFIANSPLSKAWEALWQVELAIELGPWHVRHSLLHWINDGLMAVFFFVVGLELKREFIAGSLATPRQALLPLAAALGGMLVPAGLYLIFNFGGPGMIGWGIPMATDIAFAVGVMALLGPRVPVALRILVTALAIADDLGAVLVIAAFYTSQIDLVSLGTGAFFLAVLVGANVMGVRRPLYYGLIGIGGIWLSFLSSGIHASIAGVLIALTIPARPKIDETTFTGKLKQVTDEFLRITPNKVSLLEPSQAEALENIQVLTRSADTPLQRIEHMLGPWVSFLVVPLFALANAGVRLDANGLEVGPVVWGVLVGLVAGKWIGITVVAWILHKSGWVRLPDGLGFRELAAAGFLGGIGFTMSLFITNLAFGESELAVQAKLGVLMASLLAAVAAAWVLSFRRSPIR